MDGVLEYKYLGLLAVIILTLGLSFVAFKWSEGKHLSFSQHVAKRKHRIVYYNLLFTVVLPLLLLFFLGWFMPTFALPVWFGYLIIMSSVTQYVCTLVPEVGGRKTYYHRLLAGISALLLLPVQMMLVFAGNIEPVYRLLALAGMFIMLGVILLVAKGKGHHGYMLLLQSIYFAAFFIPILFIAYL